MDEHVPSPITQGLRLRGVDVLIVQDDGRTGIPDALVLERATELGRILFTIDADYYAIVAACQRAGTTMAGVIKGQAVAVVSSIHRRPGTHREVH